MKLIDVLVKELSESGGWPEGAKEFHRHGMLEFDAYFYGDGGGQIGKSVAIPSLTRYCGDANGETITREQYEAALAASNQSAWSGEGRPPVGAECEALIHGEWQRVTVAYHRMDNSVDSIVFNTETTVPYWADEFRPISTEAERRREKAINQMMDCSAVLVEATAGLIYDAIAAGKTPGVKLESSDE